MKKQATYGDYVITINDDNSVAVTCNGEECNNAKKALREVSEKAGFAYEEGWNTRQHGAKLVDFLNEGAPAVAPQQAPEVEEEKERSTPAESFEASAQESTSAKVRVYGKAQNRTALGIVHAYMVMYPHATLEDLRKAFPGSINPDSGVKDLFIYADEDGSSPDWNGYFKGEDELVTTGDGKKVAVAMLWTKQSLERIIAQAKNYDIDVEQVDTKVEGGFRLEYLNGFTPKAPTKKKSKWILWVLLAMALVSLGAFVLL